MKLTLYYDLTTTTTDFFWGDGKLTLLVSKLYHRMIKFKINKQTK